jgi:hypothetical protein
MARPKRTSLQREADRLFIEQQAIHGLYDHQIAEALAKERPYVLSRAMIAYERNKLKHLWREQANEMINTEKASQLKELRAQKIELWAAWEKSKLDAQTRTAVRDGPADPKNPGAGKQSVTVSGQCGDVSYQAQIRGINSDIRALLGLDAPERHELSGPGGTQLVAPTPTQVHVVIVDNHRDKLNEFRTGMSEAPSALSSDSNSQIYLSEAPPAPVEPEPEPEPEADLAAVGAMSGSEFLK